MLKHIQQTNMLKHIQWGKTMQETNMLDPEFYMAHPPLICLQNL